ncbi:MAG: hypothetical protein M3285_03640 [Actinomycetota bacterium]|nr:hypothetical protein [Actinomycetota bacterium]
MDLNRLSTGEKVLGISGLVLFITSFLSMWAKVDYRAEGLPEEAVTGLGEPEFTLWNGYGILPKLGVLIALLLVVFVVAKAAGALGNVNLPVPETLIYLGGAAIVVLTMLIALIFGTEGANESSGFGVTVEVERGLLLYLGVLLSLAMAAGAYLHMQEAGPATTTGTGVGPSTPTPPPPAT